LVSSSWALICIPYHWSPLCFVHPKTTWKFWPTKYHHSLFSNTVFIFFLIWSKWFLKWSNFTGFVRKIVVPRLLSPTSPFAEQILGVFSSQSSNHRLCVAASWFLSWGMIYWSPTIENENLVLFFSHSPTHTYHLPTHYFTYSFM
jgi:hypothetical protein